MPVNKPILPRESTDLPMFSDLSTIKVHIKRHTIAANFREKVLYYSLK